MTLGNFATKLLLRTDTGITRMRGRHYEWWLDSFLVPTFHPAAALRGRDRVTDQMREDFALVSTLLATPRNAEQPEPATPQDAEQQELFG